MKPGVVIHSSAAETIRNAFGLDVFALKQGDSGRVFLPAKGADASVGVRTGGQNRPLCPSGPRPVGGANVNPDELRMSMGLGSDRAPSASTRIWPSKRV